MRKPEYLSPSNVRRFFEDRDEWYINYMSDSRPNREPQMKQMAIGSSFDAFAKHAMHYAIYGHNGKDDRFELRKLFEAQVEPQHRDWAWGAGQFAFNSYKISGAFSDLMVDLQQAMPSSQQFEIDVKGTITTKIGGIPILGKPDVFFLNKDGHFVILDFKVNGWFSKASPKKGYVRIRSTDPNDRADHHRDAVLQQHQGTLINIAHYLDAVDEEWALQLATYGWLCGEQIGNEFITAIDQLACTSSPDLTYPRIRIAQHRTRISKAFQEHVLRKYETVWNTIQTGHIFPDLSREESDAKVVVMDKKAEQLFRDQENPDDPMTKLYKQARKKR